MQSILTVKKIIDVQLDRHSGRKLYKVKWTESWEDEESLLEAHSNLVQDFWSFVKQANSLNDETDGKKIRYSFALVGKFFLCSITSLKWLHSYFA